MRAPAAAAASAVAVVLLGMAASAAAKDPDAGKNMIELVTSKGYPIEEHFVTTEDGYILGAFRIPYGRAGQSSTPRPPVFLQHGLLDSSFTWVNNEPSESLGYILADAGFDVWLGNSRGNTWSRQHVKYSVDSNEFWDFTWDEMARYDLPANIEYVLAATGRDQLSYVGHSQGTIQAFASFSVNQTVAKKVNYFAALAPVAYVEHSPVELLHIVADLHVGSIMNFFGIKEFLPSTTLLQTLGLDTCAAASWACSDILFWLCGPSTHVNQTRLDVYIAETPAGTSVRNMMHWAQGIRSDHFQMYDYGCGIFTCDNRDHYGQKTPPQYPLGNVVVPTGLYYGGKDTLADPADVARMIGELPSSTLVKKLYVNDYNHMDFVWAVDANTVVYAPLTAHLKELNGM